MYSCRALSNLLRIISVMLSLAGFLTAQTDPGPRSGAPGAGAAIPGLTVKEGKFFHSGQAQFTEVQSVTGTIAGTEEGLGPRFNLNSCSGCTTTGAIDSASSRRPSTICFFSLKSNSPRPGPASLAWKCAIAS